VASLTEVELQKNKEIESVEGEKADISARMSKTDRTHIKNRS